MQKNSVPDWRVPAIAGYVVIVGTFLVLAGWSAFARLDSAITATGVGVAHLIATLGGPGGVSIDQSYDLGVSPANPPVTRRTVLRRQLAQDAGLRDAGLAPAGPEIQHHHVAREPVQADAAAGISAMDHGQAEVGGGLAEHFRPAVGHFDGRHLDS